MDNQTPDNFNANVRVDGAIIHLSAPSIPVLTALLTRLGVLTATAATPSSAVGADEKAAVVNQTKPRTTPKADQAKALETAADAAEKVKTQAVADEAPGKQADTSSAAAAGTASGATENVGAGVSYDDVKKVVNAVYAKQPDAAHKLLADFKVKNGKDLDPHQWIEFVEAGKAKLAALQTEALA